MSAEYLSNPNTPPQPPKRDNRVVILLAAILALLLAIITAVVVIFALKAKNNKGEVNETSFSSDIVTEEQPTAELSTLDIFASTESTTEITSVNICPICGSTDIKGPDAKGYFTCSDPKCGASWQEEGNKVLLYQDGQQTQSTDTTATTAKSATTARPTTTKPTTTKPMPRPNVGETIYFGKFEQDNNTSNGKEPIEWMVLEVQGDKAFLISVCALDCRRYHNTEVDVMTWEKCSLRSWLNNDFYNASFTSGEKSRIKTTTVVAEDNPNYGTDAGKDTRDKVFCLSWSEAEKYFDEDTYLAPYTAYSKERGLYTPYGGSSWWLRTPGDGNPGQGSCIIWWGYPKDTGSPYNSFRGVRPAMWISI